MTRLAAVLAIALVAAAAGTWVLLRADPPRPPAIDLQGVSAEVRAAIADARRGVDAAPRSGEAWGRLAMVLQAHDFAADAERCYVEAERLDPANFRWPYLRGVSLAVTDRQAALKCYQRAVELEGDHPLPRLRLAELLIDLGRLDEAEPHVRAVLRQDPSSARAELDMARLAALRGEWPECRRWAERSAARMPMQRSTRELLAQACHRLGDRKGTAEQQAILERIPEGETNWEDPLVAEVLRLRRDAAWMSIRAQDLLQQGRYGEAIALLERLVSQRPESPAFVFDLARALMSAGAHTRAVQVLEEAMERGVASSEILRLRGVLHFGEREWDRAAERFRQSLELKPDSAVTRYNLGHALDRLGETEAALEAFRDAVHVQPDYADAHTNVGRLLLELGRRSEALAHLRIASELAPDDPVPARLLKEASAG